MLKPAENSFRTARCVDNSQQKSENEQTGVRKMGKKEKLALKQAFTDVLDKNYGLSATEIKSIGDHFLIATDRGVKVLRKTKLKEPQFLFIYSAIAHLKDRGFTQVIEPIQGMDGKPFFFLGDQLYYLVDWVEGRECDFSDREDIILASKTLGRLHKAARGLEPLLGSKIKSEWGKWFEKWQNKVIDLEDFKEIIEDKKQLNDVDRIFLEHLDYYIFRAKKAIGLLKKGEYLNLVQEGMANRDFCQYDFEEESLLVDRYGRLWVIGVEDFRFEVQSYDLAKFIKEVVKEGKVNCIKDIIESYREENLLDKRQIICAAAFICFPEKFWHYGERYYLTKKVLLEKKLIKKINKFASLKDAEEEAVEILLAYGKA